MRINHIKLEFNNGDFCLISNSNFILEYMETTSLVQVFEGRLFEENLIKKLELALIKESKNTEVYDELFSEIELTLWERLNHTKDLNCLYLYDKYLNPTKYEIDLKNKYKKFLLDEDGNAVIILSKEELK